MMSSFSSCCANRMTSLRNAACSSVHAKSKVLSPGARLSVGLLLRLRLGLRLAVLLGVQRFPRHLPETASGQLDARGHAHDGSVVRNIRQHYAVGDHEDVVPNLDFAEDLATRPKITIVPDA